MTDIRTLEGIVRDISKLVGKNDWLVGAGLGGSRDKPKLVLAVKRYDPIIKSTVISTVKSSYMLEDSDIEVIEVGEIEAFFRG